MAITTSSIAFPYLTPGEQRWRIDWFGEIGYPDRIKRSSQPSVKVAVSPLLNDSDPLSSSMSNQRVVWMPIGSLLHLRIGDIWQNGKCLVKPDYKIQVFTALDVQSGNFNFIKAGLSEEGEFILPLKSHPWHIADTNAYCLQVNISDSERLIIPCMELIRFYFGSSSTLLMRLFAEPLKPEHLWEIRTWDPVTRRLYLRLADKIYGYSAADIGRIATSQDAWNSAAGIHKSILKTGVNTSHSHAYTTFPFKGKTDLSVSGLWLPEAKNGMKTFAVFQLRSCSYPFPFVGLRYDSSDKSPWQQRSQSNSISNGMNSSGFKNRTTLQLDIKDPNKTKSSGISKAIEKLRFPDLRNKPVYKDKIEDAPTNGPVYRKKSNGQYELISIGSPYSSGQGREAELVTGQFPKNIDKSKLPKFVTKVIDSVQSRLIPNQTISLVVPEGYVNAVFPLPTLQDENGITVPIVIFTLPNGNTRQRRACVLEVSAFNVKQETIIIVEGRNFSTKEDHGPTWESLGFPFELNLK